MKSMNNVRCKHIIYIAVASIIRRNLLSAAWSISSIKPINRFSSTSSVISTRSLNVYNLGYYKNRYSKTAHFSTTIQEDSTASGTSASTTTVTTKEFNRDDYPDNIILFDGICNFCNTWVDILLRLDSNTQKFVFTPLQSNVGKHLLISIGKESDDISSVLLIKRDGEYYDKSDCVLQVVKEIGPVGNVLSSVGTVGVPIKFRNSIYDMVAENRYNFLGKRDECRSGDPKFFDRFIS